MNQLKELLDQIKDKQAEASIIPEEADPRVRAGVESLQRNAVAAVELLKNQYKEAVIGSAVIIAAQGVGSAKFAELAAEKAKLIALDYKSINTKLTERLLARQSGNVYNQNVHFMLLDELNKLKLEYGIMRLPTPMVSYLDGIYDQPLSEALPKLLEKNYESSLYSIVTRREISEAAIKLGFTGNKLPIVVYNYTGQVDTNSLPSPTKVIEINGTVSEKLVRQTLNEVRSLVQGKTIETETESKGETNE